MKCCRTCNLEKSISEYGLKRGKPVLDCKICFRSKQRLDWKIKGRSKGRASWAEKNKEKDRAYKKKYRDANKQKGLDYRKKRRSENPVAKITENLRHRIGMVLRGLVKVDKTLNLLGCNLEEFKLHLESKFTQGMSWENYGVYKIGKPMTWHIDHILPCASFDLIREEEQRKCFHYTNLQPLWAIDNIIKGNKL